MSLNTTFIFSNSISFHLSIVTDLTKLLKYKILITEYDNDGKDHNDDNNDNHVNCLSWDNLAKCECAYPINKSHQIKCSFLRWGQKGINSGNPLAVKIQQSVLNQT